MRKKFYKGQLSKRLFIFMSSPVLPLSIQGYFDYHYRRNLSFKIVWRKQVITFPLSLHYNPALMFLALTWPHFKNTWECRRAIHTYFTDFEYRLLLVVAWLVLSLLEVDPNSGSVGSDPNSRAPNWTFNPVMSADPGISTAEAGILKEEKKM